MRYKILLILLLSLTTIGVSAQTDSNIEKQKKVIAAIEKRIADEEREIAKLRSGKAAAQDKIGRLARQIGNRNQLISATEKEAQLLHDDLEKITNKATILNSRLGIYKQQYAEMIREAYRNYKHNNYIAYIFASESFDDVARKITNLRAVAAIREQKIEQIITISDSVTVEKRQLNDQKQALESNKIKLARERTKLRNDENYARSQINNISKKERGRIKEKVAQEGKLDVAISELRKLSKGNKKGNSFSKNTSNLRLPVSGGRVKRYIENMAEITGAKGSKVASIYEGKVVDVKRNRITNRFDVYIAHGEYITSYTNLESVTAQKGSSISKNETIGVIGPYVDIMTMNTEYRLVFGIYSPNPAETMKAENCFK